jgi:hypothetical protein
MTRQSIAPTNEVKSGPTALSLWERVRGEGLPRTHSHRLSLSQKGEGFAALCL